MNAAFLALAALLVALTLGTLGWALLRRPPEGAADAHGSGTGAGDQRAANVAIAREQLAALSRARDAGDVDEAAFTEERDRLERSLAAALDGEAAPRRRRGAALGLAAVVALGVPAATALVYLRVGQPEALVLGPDSRGAGNPQAGGGVTGGGTGGAPSGGAPEGDPAAGPDAERVASLEELLPQLEARLAERPEDLAGWSLLGRTYLNLERFDEAATALERASGLAPDDPDLLTALGEARAMRAGGTLIGDALEPLEGAIEVDPMHQQGLWLLGIARQQANRHDEAVELLTRLRGIAAGAGDAGAVATIDDYLSRSRQALGMAPVAPGGIGSPAAAPEAAEEQPGTRPGPGPGEAVTAVEPSAPAAPAPAPPDAADAADAPAITVNVSLSPEAAAATAPDQAVFVFARASEGPPMPLAAARLTVAELPATVTLDESAAMVPTMTVGTFPSVTVGARVSASGEPAAASGDWFDEAEGVEPAARPSLELVIDRQVP